MPVENSVYSYLNSPDRAIFLDSGNAPKLHFIKFIGLDMIKSFSTLLNVGNSRFITNDSKNLIVGAFVGIKISDEVVTAMIENQELLDATFITNDRGNVIIFTKFLWTNDIQLYNTMTEINSYLSILLDTQLKKYNISEDDYIYNRDELLYINFTSQQTIQFSEKTGTVIKKAHKYLFLKKEQDKETVSKEQGEIKIKNEKKNTCFFFKKRIAQQKKKESVEVPISEQKKQSSDKGNPPKKETVSDVSDVPEFVQTNQTSKKGKNNEFTTAYKDIKRTTAVKEHGELYLAVKSFFMELFLPEKTKKHLKEERDRTNTQETLKLKLETNKIELAKKKAKYKQAEEDKELP